MTLRRYSITVSTWSRRHSTQYVIFSLVEYTLRLPPTASMPRVILKEDAPFVVRGDARRSRWAVPKLAVVSYLLPALMNTPILEAGEKFSRDAIINPFGNFVISRSSAPGHSFTRSAAADTATFGATLSEYSLFARERAGNEKRLMVPSRARRTRWADAHGSGPCESNFMRVQVPPLAPKRAPIRKKPDGRFVLLSFANGAGEGLPARLRALTDVPVRWYATNAASALRRDVPGAAKKIEVTV